jgi:predicted molibdopterin-dependent oxidoreductase YjgC
LSEIRVNGRAIQVLAGTTVAAALLKDGQFRFRSSVSGESRAPLCGIGVCFECRVTVDGKLHARSCQVVVRDGMEITT